MAGSFTDATTHPVTVILPSGSAATWNEYSAVAQPSGIVFRVRFAPAISTPAFIAEELGRWADVFNQKAGMLGVQSISTYQDIDANNQIEDRVSVVVQSDSGNSTGIVDLPQGTLQPGLPTGSLQTFNDAVDNERLRLNAIEAL